MRIGSLFTGYGGLDLAAVDVFGGHTVWTSDIDLGACKIIGHRYPDTPNLGDITAIDWAQVEPVDILTGGWPCQPFSHAGKRLGAADERALWPEVARAVRELRPRHVVLENVAAIASAGELARATADLAALGYVGSWRCLRAADVGAPHGRARIFILATDTRRLRGKPRRIAAPGEATSGWALPVPSFGGRVDTPADTTGNGRQQGRPEPTRLLGGPDAAQRGHAAADTNGAGIETLSRRPWAGDAGRPEPVVSDGPNWGAYEPAIRRWERTLGRRTRPHRSQPTRHTTPLTGLRGVDDGSARRVGDRCARTLP